MNLIIITGLPGTGKSTIGEALSLQLQIPIFSKDVMKNFSFDALQVGGREWSKKVAPIAYNSLYWIAEQCLAVNVSCILESNFDPRFDNQRINQLITKYKPTVIQILCKTQGDVLFKRFAERAVSGTRHPGHGDADNLDEFKELLKKGRSEPLDVGGELVEIDTTDFSNVDVKKIIQDLKSLQRGLTEVKSVNDK